MKRIEIVHPSGGNAGGGTLFLDDGSERALDENAINWVMRMMPDLLGAPALGTQDASSGYWSGKQPPESADSPTDASNQD